MMLDQSKVIAAVVVALAALTGCHNDRPHDYGEERPPVGQLDSRDKGLQSKDVISASEQMTQDLLSSPELNEAKSQWTMVVDRMENQTTDKSFSTNFDIFIQRLQTQLSQQGHGRVRLIENRARFYDLRSKELEQEREDNPAPGAPAKAAVQPDFALYGKAMDLPNRATNYYQLQFDVTNLKTREIVWSRTYEVKVAR